MALNISFDTSDFDDKMAELEPKTKQQSQKGIAGIATELMRMSQTQVPHDIGTLQNSGFVEDMPDESIVGYGGNAAPYASWLHENPQFRFQKGRKGKYLEDPMKNNLDVFLGIYKDAINGIF